MRTALAALASLAFAAGLLLGLGVAVPRPAMACSCIGPQPLAAYAGPDTVIVAGTVVDDDGDGVTLSVDRWFSGTGPTAFLRIGGDFGNGASCGIGMRPPVGSSWLAVAWRPPDEGIENPLDPRPVQVNICQPFADVATPEGAALLEEAEVAFGEGVAIPTSEPGGSPVPGAAPIDGGGGAAGSTDLALLVAVGAAIVAGVLVLGVALVLGSRGRRPRPGA